MVVGPYTIIGENVIIGDYSILESNIKIEKWTQIGEKCHIHSGSIIGSEAQDVKYKGEKTWVIIGNNNIIREYVTINRSTGKDTVTKIGDNNLLLTNVHIGHNCELASDIIIANMTNLGGHTIVEDRATIGGMTGIHQFCRIGRGCMVGAYTRLPQDIPPFMLCEGNPAYIRGMNIVGMKRQGFSREAMTQVKQIFKTYYQTQQNTAQAVKELESTEWTTPQSQHLYQFIVEKSSRGICKKQKDSSD